MRPQVILRTGSQVQYQKRARPYGLIILAYYHDIGGRDAINSIVKKGILVVFINLNFLTIESDAFLSFRVFSIRKNYSET